jgi:hypothetical protein
MEPSTVAIKKTGGNRFFIARDKLLDALLEGVFCKIAGFAKTIKYRQ